jgi:uncharacterized protein YukE
MDIAQIRSLAVQMNNEAQRIETLVQRLTSQLEAVPWKGPDRERFLGSWRSTHARALDRIATGLHQAAHEANEHARQQEWASRA